MSSLAKPRHGDVLEARIERLDERGSAIGYAQHPSGRFRVALQGALPGELVRASVIRRRGERVDARVAEIVERSVDSVAPRCEHFGVCGGCAAQDFAYGAQLVEKRRGAERTLRDVGLACTPEPVIGCAEPWRYRNKMDFTFAARRWVDASEPAGADASFALGLHPRDQHSKVLDVRHCEIQFPRADAILASVRRISRELVLAPWDLRTHTGFLRHLVLRESRATGEILASLVTSSDSPELAHPLVERLLAAHPEITTLVQNVNTRGATIAVGEREILWHGSGRIVERLANVEFEISANSFFQTNTAQAELLVAHVLRELDPRASDVVFDVYCGTGTFALPLARQSREVRGFELVESAVLDARRNAERNAVANVQFTAGDVLATLAAPDLPAADVLVVDPPRAGCHERVIELLARTPARRIVYVSCRLAAAARNVAQFTTHGWRLARVQPIDLFPHTPHLECVLTLDRP